MARYDLGEVEQRVVESRAFKAKQKARPQGPSFCPPQRKIGNYSVLGDDRSSSPVERVIHADAHDVSAIGR